MTHKQIAIAVLEGETDVTAQDLLTDSESPERKSQAADIAAWLVEFLTGKAEIRKNVVVDAAKQFSKDWSEANITKVFSWRFIKAQKGSSRTEGGGKNKVTYWSIGKKEQTPIEFDTNQHKPPTSEKQQTKKESAA